MAVKALPPPVVAPFTWTGFYIGANAGGAWSRTDVTTILNPLLIPPNDAAIAAADSPRLTGSGFTGGAQAGFNYQMGFAVWGLEADINDFRTSGSKTVNSIYPLGGGPLTASNSFSTSWLATVRPRLGVIAFDRGLIYATGGLAVTHFQYNTVFTDTGGDFEAASISTTRAGWTVGGGLEYALRGNWSAKIEYLHLDFGKLSTSGLDLGVETLAHSVSLTSDLVRAGLNYQFPIAAHP
jgi:outer membrane immunogenic protein